MIRMTRVLIAGCLVVSSATLYGGQAQPPKAVPSHAATMTATVQQATLNQYCITCHNSKAKTAGFVLEGVDVTRAGENAAVLENAVRRLRAGMMPPPGAPRPDAATLESLAASLESSLDAAAVKPNLVPPGLHRLNRTEYANAVRDLLGLEIDPAAYLPVDDSSSGFDNVAGSLGISPALVEGYMSAAGKISRIALGREIAPQEKRYVAPQDYSQEEHVEGLPFGTRGGMLLRYNFPADGEYVISWFPVRGNTGELYGAEMKDEQLEVSIDGARVGMFDIAKIPQGIDDDKNEVRLTVKAGLRTVGLAFLANTHIPLDDLNQHYIRSVLDTNPIPGYIFSPQVGQVKLMGPYNGARAEDTASRRKILICQPAAAADEAACAGRILSTLARRAYRRPVNAADVDALLTFFQKARSKGSFEDGIERGVQAILSDPEFVFRAEAAPARLKAGDAYRISDLELASRLSFFLWSTSPDDQLIDLASQGKLKDPKVLEQQVQRMLADARSSALVKNFAGQWLQLRNLPSAAPVTQMFPDFDDNLRQAFRTEAEMFFESVLREGRSVVDLLTADYTFVNERLARHYGIRGVYGSQFRRVKLNGALESRRGLLGKGAILLVTANADRTSPVLRGKWVLMNILGVVPPEPPANVPALRQSDKMANGQPVPLEISMRERMQEHRANPVCASCHLKMDPIGFAMEGFDAVGKARSTEWGKPLDLTGQLSDGVTFDGVVGLRQALERYSPQFVATITEKLVVYALGRGVDHRDMPMIRAIVRDGARSNYRMSSLILGIVKSAPFSMNLNDQEKGAADARQASKSVKTHNRKGI
jgi:mono/diheme cytochrome c family protein